MGFGIGWIELMLVGGVGILVLLGILGGVLYMLMGGSKNEPRND